MQRNEEKVSYIERLTNIKLEYIIKKYVKNITHPITFSEFLDIEDMPDYMKAIWIKIIQNILQFYYR